ncbi:hypothetical protein O9K51_01512 [Purpureocillium lavendulum]|uniref:Uncharacterized protein n=1 Tax=Purpureocillium lavendulum TaxID=1247861 RepID=A0AB34G5P5_9HYPO|nr:hypothetical protein O9K51_01512 [Purpureocillium lavendulum]
MDHLPLADGASLPPIGIPYVAIALSAAPYIHGEHSFIDFPVHHLQELQLVHPDLGPQDALLSLAQSWLFFGTLVEFFREPVPSDSFTRLDSGGRRIICTSSLHGLRSRWIAALPSRFILTATARQVIGRRCGVVLARATWALGQLERVIADDPRGRLVAFSIKLLLCSLCQTLRTVLYPTRTLDAILTRLRFRPALADRVTKSDFLLWDYMVDNGCPIVFWMDVFCIPVERQGIQRNTDLKGTAIQLMDLTYSCAHQVLVLDAEMESIEPQRGSGDELGILNSCLGTLARATTCRWMTRSWTLQEGALASTLWIDYAQRLTPHKSFYDFRIAPSLVDQAAPEILSLIDILEEHTALPFVGRGSQDMTHAAPYCSSAREVQFLEVWNSLIGRSTTKPEDFHCILAKQVAPAFLLDFSVHELLKVGRSDSPQPDNGLDMDRSNARMRSIIQAQKRLPMQLFCFQGRNALNGNKMGWLPEKPIGPPLTDDAFLRSVTIVPEGFAMEGSCLAYCFLAWPPPNAATSFCLDIPSRTSAHPHVVLDLPDAGSVSNSELLIYLNIDADAHTLLSESMQSGAAFLVTERQTSSLKVTYLCSVKFRHCWDVHAATDDSCHVLGSAVSKKTSILIAGPESSAALKFRRPARVGANLISTFPAKLFVFTAGAALIIGVLLVAAMAFPPTRRSLFHWPVIRHSVLLFYFCLLCVAAFYVGSLLFICARYISSPWIRKSYLTGKLPWQRAAEATRRYMDDYVDDIPLSSEGGPGNSIQGIPLYLDDIDVTETARDGFEWLGADNADILRTIRRALVATQADGTGMGFWDIMRDGMVISRWIARVQKRRTLKGALFDYGLTRGPTMGKDDKTTVEVAAVTAPPPYQPSSSTPPHIQPEQRSFSPVPLHNQPEIQPYAPPFQQHAPPPFPPSQPIQLQQMPMPAMTTASHMQPGQQGQWISMGPPQQHQPLNIPAGQPQWVMGTVNQGYGGGGGGHTQFIQTPQGVFAVHQQQQQPQIVVVGGQQQEPKTMVINNNNNNNTTVPHYQQPQRFETPSASLIVALVGLATSSAVREMKKQSEVAGFNPVAVKAASHFGTQVIKTGVANSGHLGLQAAVAGATNAGEAILSAGVVAAGVPAVAKELAEAVHAGAFEGFAGPDSALQRWDDERMRNGEARKQAIIEWAKGIAGAFETLIPGYPDPPPPPPNPSPLPPPPPRHSIMNVGFFLCVIVRLVATNPVDNSQRQREVAGFNPAPVIKAAAVTAPLIKDLGNKAIKAGAANSGHLGPEAAAAGAVNAGQAIIMGGAAVAGGATVASKLGKAAVGGAFDDFGGQGSSIERWDADRMKKGEERKQALIQVAKDIGEAFEKLIPGHPGPLCSDKKHFYPGHPEPRPPKFFMINWAVWT